MGVMRRHPTAAALGALALLAALAAHDAWRLGVAEDRNARVASGAVPAADRPDDPPELRFARAAAHAASGAVDAALQRYGALHGNGALGRAARYNSANLLLRRAIELRESAHPGQALAYVELAKEHYREVLRDDPSHWEARYNLARAQRLVPEPEEVDESPPEPRRDAERAATTMRGYSAGLP